MAKDKHKDDDEEDSNGGYKKRLRSLQVELVKLQRHIIAHKKKVLVILEGRDAAGKDGTIKRITQHLSPRETRVVALGKPSDRDTTTWYFQRWAPYLPAAEEFVLFNRSWYNRAGVERVMGFCTTEELHEFFEIVEPFEQMLLHSNLTLFKYYLDISRKEQAARLEDRREDPLKQWKVSPIDNVANKLWKEYSEARNEMFSRTHSPISPWTIVRADDKKEARLGLIADLLMRIEYDGKDTAALQPNPDLVFTYDPSYVESGLIAP
ncbi:MAG: polyphosphate kinase 2 [Alphaproteobacteria bacterium]|nr:polyphosphate kinase 2 [Alphaproteobacteria bacterium]